MAWIRLYTDILDDEKVACMCPTDLKIFIFLLLVTKERQTDGVITPDLKTLSWRFRMPEKVILKSVKKLIELNILKRKNSTLVFINWNKRQYKSDDINERVKRHREKECNVSGNVTSNNNTTLPETPPDTDTDTEQRQNRTETEKKLISPKSDDSRTPAIEPTGSEDPLGKYLILNGSYTGLLTQLKEAHKIIKLPQAGGKEDGRWREELAKLVRIDEIAEQEIVDCLTWVLTSEHKQSRFWRKNLMSFGALRKVSGGEGVSKFKRMYVEWQASDGEEDTSGEVDWSAAVRRLVPGRSLTDEEREEYREIMRQKLLREQQAKEAEGKTE